MKSLIALALAAMSGVAAAQSVEMSLLSPKGDDQKIGQIKYEQTDYGYCSPPTCTAWRRRARLSPA